jgi:predicted pyridoxine 5'-phosphate oxidase superfamily flavin-nucleotide-binding protein
LHRPDDGGLVAGYCQPRLDSDAGRFLAAFIAAQTSVFPGTANAAGQPYIQHRGGPAGFLHVLDEKTIGFADVQGNRQFITMGNLAENPKAHLFLIDYVRRQRVKI